MEIDREKNNNEPDKGYLQRLQDNARTQRQNVGQVRGNRHTDKTQSSRKSKEEKKACTKRKGDIKIPKLCYFSVTIEQTNKQTNKQTNTFQFKLRIPATVFYGFHFLLFSSYGSHSSNIKSFLIKELEGGLPEVDLVKNQVQ